MKHKLGDKTLPDLPLEPPDYDKDETKELSTEVEPRQWYYFTFGYGHNPGIGYYAKFYGTYLEARSQMCRNYGDKWAFQYGSMLKAGVERFNLKEVK